MTFYVAQSIHNNRIKEEIKLMMYNNQKMLELKNSVYVERMVL
jgi:hypothetical protein